jgi:hypothetical protein
MAKKTYTVTFKDGATHSRKSERAYTYAYKYSSWYEAFCYDPENPDAEIPVFHHYTKVGFAATKELAEKALTTRLNEAATAPDRVHVIGGEVAPVNG